MVEVDDFRGDCLFAGKGQQLPGKISRSEGGSFNLFEFLFDGRILSVMLESHIGIAENDTQHIIEIMGNTTCQTTN